MLKPVLLRSCALIVALFTLVSVAAAQELRTWSDASGKFKIKAKFLSEDGGTVTLETEDGKELEIELKKLSSADQKAVADLKKEMSDSPFKSKGDDPFKPKGTGSAKTTPKKNADDADEPSPQSRDVSVNWTEAEVITLGGASEEWKLDPPAAEEPIFKNRGKTVALPAKSNFFEGLKGLAVSAVAKKAAVGYVLGEPKPRGTTRVLICDLETGKAGTAASTLGQMIPLALHDDGKQIVMRREEFGFGNQDRMEVWTLRGSKITKLVEWVPYTDLNGADKDVLWAEFTDAETLATSSRSGRVALWKFPDIAPICYFDTVNGGVPGLSPDRKLIAYSNGEHIGIFDVAKREVTMQRPTPSKLTWPYLAFSPSGKRIGCIAQDKMLCWNTEDGALINEIPANGAQFHGGIDFPHDNFILANNRILVDVENQIKLWQYDGAEQLKSVGGWTFIAATDGSKPGRCSPGNCRIPWRSTCRRRHSPIPACSSSRPEAPSSWT
ncbi:MAG TPA: SHD1 domain-containing protein [Planctomycetaceae bacterium]|nr:SHD1 domain-containing protein [Planctomycetaceae bacterium]